MSRSAPRVVLVNPNTTASMTEIALRAAQEVAAPGTVLVGRTSPTGPASIESHVDESLCVPGLLQAVAEETDADAFVVACFGDPGVEAVRELTGVPVVGIAEAAMKSATLLGRTFSVVTTLERTIGRARDLVTRHGLTAQCAGLHACDIPVLELETDPDGTYDRLLKVSAEVLRHDACDVLVLGCAGMADLPGRLAAELGVPVVDGVAAATTMAEGLVRQGLVPRREGELAPPVPKAYTGVMGQVVPAAVRLSTPGDPPASTP